MFDMKPFAIAAASALFTLVPLAAQAAPTMCGCYNLNDLCAKLGGQPQGFASHGLYCVINKQSADSVGSLSYRMQDAAKDCAMFDKKMDSNLGKLVAEKKATCAVAPPPPPPQPSYGAGPVVACYIKDRSKPNAMPGWTMLWKDGVGRAKGCKEQMDACKTMTKNWAGQDYCCTLQGGDVKVTGKKAGDACVF